MEPVISTPDELGITEVESMCMSCGENGLTKFLMHKIPYFRELIIASFECEHCGERNNEVTFGGEIQIQGSIYELECTNAKDLDRQLIKSDSASVYFPSLDFEIPPKTQKGEISTIEGFLTTAARNLSLYQRERMAENPEVGAKVAEIIVELGRMSSGVSFPFKIVVNDPAGNSFVENPFAPKSDPKMRVRHYHRTPEQDISLGLQPEHGIYRKDEDTNFKSLIEGRGGFGGEKNVATQDEVPPSGGGEGDGAEPLGRSEAVSIPQNCPNCNHPGECLTALTDIPHFKEVIIMAFTCSQCGYKNSEVKGGGAVPTLGTEVTLHATSADDLKRDVLKSDSAMVRIPELDLELQYGTLGGVYTTVEGLLQKIEASLRDCNPFALGDSTRLHHSEALKTENATDRFIVVMDHLKEVYSGQRFPFTLVLRDPLGNSFISAHIGSFIPPEADSGLSIEDFQRTWEENEEFGLNDMNTKDFETGVSYDDGPILSDRLTHVLPKGADHPTPFAQGVKDSTPSGVYFDTPVAGPAPEPYIDDTGKKVGWTSVGPSWGPVDMAKELGCPAPNNEESNDDAPVVDGRRHFNERDFTLKFSAREEFGGARPGFVFRLGAQGLGYYEDVGIADDKSSSTVDRESPVEAQDEKK